MEQLFLRIVNISIVASYLVLAIICLRFVLKKAPKWVMCLLWGLVAVRLLFPFSIESALSLIPSAEPLPEDFTYAAHPYVNSGVNAIDRVVNPVVSASLETGEGFNSVNTTQVVSFVFSRLWVVGIAIMIVYAAVSTFMLKRKLRTATLLEPGIKQSETVDSPFVLGVFKPVIYIPYSLTEANLKYVINHEKAHIMRRDHIWKPLGFLLLSAYWFNPLMWVAYILLCKDIESACDEKVIKDMDLDSRRAYSNALLSLSVKRKMITACPVAFGENGVKSRIKGVMNYRKPAFWIICASVLACIVVAVCFLTNPKGNKGEDIAGKYVRYPADKEAGFYMSALNIDDDGTFNFSPSVISSYMGLGTWEADGDRVFFKDTGMGDIRTEVFRLENGHLYYVAAESAENSLWKLEDGDEYIPEAEAESFESIVNKTPESLTSTETPQTEKSETSATDNPGEEDVSKVSVGDIDNNGVEDYILTEGESFAGEYGFNWTFVLNGEEIYKDYNSLFCDFSAYMINLDADSDLEILVLVSPHVNSMPLQQYVVLKKKGNSWVELENTEDFNTGYDRGNVNSFPVKVTMGEGMPISMDIACEGIDYVVNADISKHYENMISEYEDSDYGAEFVSFAKEMLSGEKYKAGEEFATLSAWGIWEMGVAVEKGVNYLVATHGIQSNEIGKFDIYGTLDIRFNYDSNGKIKIYNMGFNSYTQDTSDASEDKEVTSVTSLKWDDWGFDCWPLSGGILRDEWSSEMPFYQFVAPKGTPVYAVMAGTATYGFDNTNGNYVELRLNDIYGTVIRYSHLDEVLTGTAYIEAGTEIGTVGATGSATGPFLKIEIARERTVRTVNEAEKLEKEVSFAGIKGKLVADIAKSALSQPEPIEVVLEDNDGKAVWKTELGIPHTAWTSYYVYNDNGTDYLIEYLPEVSQGMVCYSFIMYKFDAVGRIQKVEEHQATDTGEIAAFEEATKPYLKNAQLFISTINGVVTTGM